MYVCMYVVLYVPKVGGLACPKMYNLNSALCFFNTVPGVWESVVKGGSH